MRNKLAKIIDKINLMPTRIQRFLLTRVFCSKVKYAGTTGIEIVSWTDSKAVVQLKNKKKVQNHIGTIHAVAAAVLAESTTGIVFGMNVPDHCIPLLKSMKIDYQRRMQGKLTATAQLTQVQQEIICSTDKGEIFVNVEITDESNQQPIICAMEWAWVPKRK
ncbi:DUF4442 domain-containing protein [Thalassotalea sediminis]|uniref:DUF4442 domain-containing protein n=1 Tax=Thalassotalea sediminis TaxID=1759089 RepID=UPI002574190E|nr:DUF4442 domain-containing protein [Thalassotalea sediminis]